MAKRSIYVGFDPDEAAAFWVAVSSIRRWLSTRIPIYSLELLALEAMGLYTRPREVRCGKLFDVISRHPMSTEFANSRFLTPYLGETGWALFVDGDILARADLTELFDLADSRYAVMCVKHNYQPTATLKMDNQKQSVYPFKNWSSVVLYNCDHPTNKWLTPDKVNKLRGIDLHSFCWVPREQIGSLPEEYNFLPGHSSHPNPKIVHFTEGGPWLEEYRNVAFADEWRLEQRLAARDCSI
jgi:hypothetical protein